MAPALKALISASWPLVGPCSVGKVMRMSEPGGPLGVKIPCRRGGRGRDERTEESIRFGVSDDTTVVDDRYCCVLDGCVPSAPRIKGKMSTHEDLPWGSKGLPLMSVPT